jgi:hypothetical protein
MLRRPRLLPPIAVLVVTLAFAAACGSDDEVRTVVVRHPATPAPTLLDLGDEGPSVGDTRIWQFGAQRDDGEDVRTDWTMITTAVDAPEPGFETRMSKGVFTFAGGDVLILEGALAYPAAGAVLAEETRVTRVVVGGAGAFDGARGEVESTHFADGTWQHEFRLR